MVVSGVMLPMRSVCQVVATVPITTSANMTAAGQSCMISITEDESDHHYSDNGGCQAEGVAIVFGVLPEQLAAILNTVLGPFVNNQ